VKGKLFEKLGRSAPFPPEARNTIIVKAIIEEGEIKKVSYIPCYINEEAEPAIVTRSDPKAEKVYSYIENITHYYNFPTKFIWEGGEVVIST
jgi:poly-gamma-glutamate synthesis protein (capsule biosynthesis protein)